MPAALLESPFLLGVCSWYKDAQDMEPAPWPPGPGGASAPIRFPWQRLKNKFLAFVHNCAWGAGSGSIGWGGPGRCGTRDGASWSHRLQPMNEAAEAHGQQPAGGRAPSPGQCVQPWAPGLCAPGSHSRTAGPSVRTVRSTPAPCDLEASRYQIVPTTRALEVSLETERSRHRQIKTCPHKEGTEPSGQRAIQAWAWGALLAGGVPRPTRKLPQRVQTHALRHPPGRRSGDLPWPLGSCHWPSPDLLSPSGWQNLVRGAGALSEGTRGGAGTATWQRLFNRHQTTWPGRRVPLHGHHPPRLGHEPGPEFQAGVSPRGPPGLSTSANLPLHTALSLRADALGAHSETCSHVFLYRLEWECFSR